MRGLGCVIPAGGFGFLGDRNGFPKILEVVDQAGGLSMIQVVLRTVHQLEVDPVIVVVNAKCQDLIGAHLGTDNGIVKIAQPWRLGAAC